MKKHIAIIGAGPTGIFTALMLKKFSGEVTLFEQNSDIGEKLKITGGGRMNVTNKKFSADDFFSHTERLKNNFFKSSYTKNIEKIFEELGVQYTWENNRAILASQNAKKEVARLKKLLEEQENLHLLVGKKIQSITPHPHQKFLIEEKIFDAVIICTGGMFRMKSKKSPLTKNDNAKDTIYTLPKFFEHTITDTSPSLSPLRAAPHLLKNCSGIALKTKFFEEGKKGETIYDDMLITHFGFSGPAVLDFTALWHRDKKIFINFLPTLSPEKFSQQLRSSQNGKMFIKKFLKKFFPEKLAENFLEITKISLKKNCSEILKTEEKNLQEKIFSYPLQNPQTFPYQGTWTTKGGIPLPEIAMHTLESKLQKNIFFGGEIIDIDGLCGGYHISLAALCSKIISDEVIKRSS